jgi:hypothetical protein
MTPTPVQIKTMRQSTATTADICLQRLEYYLDPGTPKKGSVNRSMGTGYHAGHAHSYLERRAGRKANLLEVGDAAVEAFDADVAENEVFDWRYQPQNYRQQEVVFDRDQAIQTMIQAIKRYYDEGHEWGPDYEVVAVEMSFDLPWPEMPGWRRSGTIDLVLAKDGQYILDDHKTARKPWQKSKGGPTNPQAAWYQAAWGEYSGSDNMAFVYSVMPFEGAFERRLATRTPKQVEMTLRRVADIARLIDQGGPFPPNPESFLCSEAYCDYWSICPYGSVLNFQDAA